ncbi:MAG: OmpH family outer membrane protein [Flavobacteriales bacterium]|nr:OmpH family outer membrane protein [Flavobacteriales bacterium]
MPVNPKICATLALCFWCSAISAQSYLQRIVVVDKNEILRALHAYGDALEYLEEREKEWKRDEEERCRVRDSVKEELMIRRVVMADEDVAREERRCEMMSREIDSVKMARYASGGEYEREYERVVGPIERQVRREIEEYATRNKVSVVIDKSDVGVLYVDKYSDVSAAIIERVKRNYKKE